MRFLVDVQLPPVLGVWLRGLGYDAQHALELGLGQNDDRDLWKMAVIENRIIVSKDEDFFLFANRPGDPLKVLWLRIGNCRTKTLLSVLEDNWPMIVTAFESGQKIVEVR